MHDFNVCEHNVNTMDGSIMTTAVASCGDKYFQRVKDSTDHLPISIEKHSESVGLRRP